MRNEALPVSCTVFDGEQAIRSLANMVEVIRSFGGNIICVLPNEKRNPHYFEFRVFCGMLEDISFEKTGLGSASSEANCMISVHGGTHEHLLDVCKPLLKGLMESQHRNARIWMF